MPEEPNRHIADYGTVRRPIKAIDLRVWRPNEYTVWSRPQREVGIGWTAYVWGCLRVVVKR